MKSKLMDTVGWGFILWAIGYACAMVLFAVVPVKILGWFVLAILIPITVFVALKRFQGSGAPVFYYLIVAMIWTIIPVVFDYLFIVKAFNVQDYYDLDVLIYYTLMFLIPVFVGVRYGKKYHIVQS